MSGQKYLALVSTIMHRPDSIDSLGIMQKMFKHLEHLVLSTREFDSIDYTSIGVNLVKYLEEEIFTESSHLTAMPEKISEYLPGKAFHIHVTNPSNNEIFNIWEVKSSTFKNVTGTNGSDLLATTDIVTCDLLDDIDKVHERVKAIESAEGLSYSRLKVESSVIPPEVLDEYGIVTVGYIEAHIKIYVNNDSLLHNLSRMFLNSPFGFSFKVSPNKNDQTVTAYISIRSTDLDLVQQSVILLSSILTKYAESSRRIKYVNHHLEYVAYDTNPGHDSEWFKMIAPKSLQYLLHFCSEFARKL